MKPQKHSSTNLYTVVELIGEGAHSLVYKAIKSDEFNQIQTTVALKILKSEELIESWKKEFESLRRVRSVHCVAVHSFERVLDRPALSLEYVDGVSLLELAQSIHLEAAQVQEIARQILLGLKDLWREGLLHGDLSPANVLISREGVVKLLDFGLANRQEKEKRATPRFVAPEVLVSNSEAEASDLFSLGKVLEFMANDPQLEIQQAIERLTSVDPSQRQAPQWSQDHSANKKLAVLVQDFLESRPAQPQVTKEFVVRSVTYVDHEPPRWLDTLRAWSISRWASIGVLGMAVIGAVFLWIQSQRANLIIRSQVWHRIWMNDQEVGYTPLDLEGITPGVHILRWESPQGSGQRALTLEPGENKVLNDSFFEGRE